ncbi:putative transmembrane domain-containing protein [Cryptosporidium canis]|uniref:Transmembrane domain-containing protein n=1 Tax=Cryptosporidium canis TaxID=195482 RepID=A0ABQ8P5V3_9CRYT|nr:putative transmembrane domain-containing protein [Cryptosporidium canis]
MKRRGVGGARSRGSLVDGNRSDQACELNERPEKIRSGVIWSLLITLLNYLMSSIKFTIHYVFSARLDKVKELYPYHATGEHEPKSKFGYRFFLVTNRVQNIGFGFEYRGVYYFSNSHFCADEKLRVDGKDVKLHQNGFTVLCSRKLHTMKKPEDDEDLYLLNPYMPTIRGKCIYKYPFYYSFFPIRPVCREFTGLPIVNSNGELISIYDNFKEVEGMIYNIIGDINLWEASRSIESVEYRIEGVSTDYRNLRIYRIISEFHGDDNASNEHETIGYFFHYNSITYISGAFIASSGSLAISSQLEQWEELDETRKYSNLYGDVWVSMPDSKHNLSLPEHNEEAIVLGLGERRISGTVKMDNEKQFWVEFDGVPDRMSLGLPILNQAGQLIGVYSGFNVKYGFKKLGYSIYLGGSSTFKNYFLRMSLKNTNIQVLKSSCDLEILEQIVLLCSTGHQGPDGIIERVIFGVGDEEISHKISSSLNLLLDKYHYSSSHPENTVSIVNNADTKYTQVQNQKFTIANIDWIGYSYLNSDNSFPFNSSKSLLILFPHRSFTSTEQLLDKYYKETPKKTRGFYVKFVQPN